MAIPDRRTSAHTKRVIALVAAVALAPLVLAWLAYYVFPREARVNYGELLPHVELMAFAGTRAGGGAFDAAALRGRWLMLYAPGAACDARCVDALYATRQARTIQNADRERVVRVLVVPAAGTVPPLDADHPDLVVVRSDSPPSLPQGPDRIYLVDPLGNFVLAWPSKPDIRAMANDLSRLLRASSIG